MCMSKRCQPSSSLFSVFLEKSASHTCENLSGICKSPSLYSLLFSQPSSLPLGVLLGSSMILKGKPQVLKTPSPKMFADAPVSSLGLEISLLSFVCWQQIWAHCLPSPWISKAKGFKRSSGKKCLLGACVWREPMQCLLFICGDFHREGLGVHEKESANKTPFRRKDTGCSATRFHILRLQDILVCIVWVFWDALVRLSRACTLFTPMDFSSSFTWVIWMLPLILLMTSL